MRAKLMFILAFIIAMTATFTSPSDGLALAQQQGRFTQPIWGQRTDTFYLELRLDQVREQLLVEIGLAPPHSMIFVEVQSTTYKSDGSQLTTIDYHAIGIGSSGVAETAVSLLSSSDVIDYRLTAYAVFADGTVDSTESWALLSRPVAVASDINLIFPGLQRDLTEEMTASRVALNDNSAIGMRFNWDGMSQSFVPSGAHSPLEFPISGPGTVYTSLPMNSMRLSSGPAGVFTAN